MAKAEELFRQAWTENCKKMEDMGIPMKRTLEAIETIGALKTAKRVLSRGRSSDGFTALAEQKRLDLSLEALVLLPAFGPLFTDEEANFCLDHLMQAGFYEI